MLRGRRLAHTRCHLPPGHCAEAQVPSYHSSPGASGGRLRSDATDFFEVKKYLKTSTIALGRTPAHREALIVNALG